MQVATNTNNGNNNSGPQSYNPNIHDQWTTWLYLAGIENPEQYNDQNIVENEELMNRVLTNPNSLNYMLSSKHFVLKSVCSSENCVDYILRTEGLRDIVLNNYDVLKCIIDSRLTSKLDEYATKVPSQSSINSNIIYSGQLLGATTPVNAFNKSNASGWNDNQMWQDKSENDDGYLGYNFNKPTRLYKVELNCATYNNANNSYSFVVEGLKENGEWEQIGDEHLVTFTSSNSFSTRTYDVVSNNLYYGYRIRNNYSVSGHGQRYWGVYSKSGFGIGELNFYCM